MTDNAWLTVPMDERIVYELPFEQRWAAAWQLLGECVADPRPLLYVSPSARLARIPWGLLAVPLAGPSREELVSARTAAITTRGTTAARIPSRRRIFGFLLSARRFRN